MEIDYSLEEINDVAQKIWDSNPQRVILFDGTMGTGKTTLIKALCSTIGIQGNTSSPTFSLVNEYQIPDGGKLFHFDVYRLKNEQEALDFGIEEYLYSGHWCLIEWPEKIKGLLPDATTQIKLITLPNGKRKLYMH